MNKLAIGTLNISDRLKRRTVYFLYEDGTWRTGVDFKKDWIVCVDILRRIYTNKNVESDCFRKLYGFNWNECKGNIENIEKQIIVHEDLSVTIDDLHYVANTDFLSGKLI